VHPVNAPNGLSVLDQCFWLLGNVAGDSVRLRDMVLRQCDFLVLRLAELMVHANVPVSMKRYAINPCSCVSALSI
jgi:hypothetical protein